MDERFSGCIAFIVRAKRSVIWLFGCVLTCFCLLATANDRSSDLEEIHALNIKKVQASASYYCDRLQQMLSVPKEDKTSLLANFQCTPAGHVWKHALASASPYYPPDLENVPVVINDDLPFFGNSRQHPSINAANAATEQPNVLVKGFKKILFVSHKWSVAYDETIATIMEELHRDGFAAQYVVFNSLGNDQALDNMIRVAELENMDLIFAIGSATMAQMTEIYAKGAIPVVTACSKDPLSIGLVDEALGISQSNIAYTSLNISVETQIAYIKERFLTNLAAIAVIYDKNNIRSILTQVEPLQEYILNGDFGIELNNIAVDFDDLHHSLYLPMQEVIKNNQQAGDTVFLITGSSEIFGIINEINDYAGNVPVLSVTPSHVRAGENSAFVAIGVSFNTNSKLAADYAIRLFEGKAETESLPVGVVTTPDISINFMRKPGEKLKVPFNFFEDSVFIFDHDGYPVRKNGRLLPVESMKSEK